MKIIIFLLPLFLPLTLSGQTADSLPIPYRGLLVWDFFYNKANNLTITEQLTPAAKAILQAIPGYLDRPNPLQQKIEAYRIENLSSNHRDTLIKSGVTHILFAQITHADTQIDSLRINFSFVQVAPPKEIQQQSITIVTTDTSAEEVKTAMRPVIRRLLGLYEQPDTRRAEQEDSTWTSIPEKRGIAKAKSLLFYLDQRYDRHRDSAQTMLNQILAKQCSIKKCEWIMGGLGLGIGVVALRTSSVMKERADDDYQIYTTYKDPGDPVYKERSREETYNESNQRYHNAQLFRIIGIGSAAFGAFFVGKRVLWSKTLKKAQKYDDCLSSSQPLPTNWTLAWHQSALTWRLAF